MYYFFLDRLVLEEPRSFFFEVPLLGVRRPAATSGLDGLPVDPGGDLRLLLGRSGPCGACSDSWRRAERSFSSSLVLALN